MQVCWQPALPGSTCFSDNTSVIFRTPARGLLKVELHTDRYDGHGEEATEFELLYRCQVLHRAKSVGAAHVAMVKRQCCTLSGGGGLAGASMFCKNRRDIHLHTQTYAVEVLLLTCAFFWVWFGVPFRLSTFSSDGRTRILSTVSPAQRNLLRSWEQSANREQIVPGPAPPKTTKGICTVSYGLPCGLLLSAEQTST